MKEFYSNGKLLITGEYVVLDGAKALGVPTKKGQSLKVQTTREPILTWKSYDCHGAIWYETQIQTTQLFDKVAPQGNSKFDETLFNILWHALQLNPLFIKQDEGYAIETHLTFERLWGLGTSSTLINNIATWAAVNPFELLHLSFGGSGYDIACAKNNTPIFYQKTNDNHFPNISPAIFNPPFKDSIHFIYLNEKKDSKQAIQNYRAIDKKDLVQTKAQISAHSEQITQCTNLSEFENIITEHEAILSSLLQTPTVKKTRFPDYKGTVKSLGGWGGDFVMVTGTTENLSYFQNKGYQIIIPFEKMVL